MDTTSVDARQQQNKNTQATGEPHQHATGLENALGKAAQKGQTNGLQAALSRAAQARGQGESGQQTAAQNGNGADTPKIDTSGVRDETSAIKTDTNRSENAPKNTEIIQQLIKTGNGQSAIQIQERPVGETTGASSPPTLTVSVQAPVASPGPASATPHVPVSALAVHIAQQASNGVKRFDIRLDPPELGRIEVRLDVMRDGKVTTHLVVERAETLDLLQRDARQLERALQDAGLKTSDEDMKFSLKDQGLAQDGDGDDLNGSDDMGNHSGDGEDNDLSLIPDDAMPPPTRYMATSGLDIRI
jgi:flagellar hook-length control protein FliK